jgi:hypothetical protein
MICVGLSLWTLDMYKGGQCSLPSVFEHHGFWVTQHGKEHFSSIGHCMFHWDSPLHVCNSHRQQRTSIFLVCQLPVASTWLFCTITWYPRTQPTVYKQPFVVWYRKLLHLSPMSKQEEADHLEIRFRRLWVWLEVSDKTLENNATLTAWLLTCHALLQYILSARWRNLLRHCATSRKVAGSICDGVIEIFHWPNRSGHAMAVGSTQPVTEMSTRDIFWG